MSKIQQLQAMEVLDSRGNPTVKVTVITEKTSASAMVPSGASTGVHEALELRDGDTKRYQGKGVLKACKNVETIIQDALKGMDVDDIHAIDTKMFELDGTENKSVLGANAILGVSLACLRAHAQELGTGLYGLNPKANLLPVPMMNVINGGKHADSGLDIQEMMIMPVGAPTFSEALRMSAEIFHTLGKILKEKGYQTAVGDEGGYAPSFPDQETAFDILVMAIEKSGYALGKEILLALDAAASEFYDAKAERYRFKVKGKSEMLTTGEMIDYWDALTQKFPIISLEDGLAEDDWNGWVMLQQKMGKRIQLVGDDLLVTNPKRIRNAIDTKAANSVLIKLNQIGSFTETAEAVTMTQKSGWTAVISHRSGETEDTTIADLAVALETGQIKTGSLCRSERTSKYNRLLEIERELGSKARYLGKNVFLHLKG